MPVGLRWGTVSAIVERHDALIRLEVDGISAVAYPRLTGPVEEGDTVLVNDQGRVLELGSGGFDVLTVNLTRGLRLPVQDGAHVTVWPYAPGQLAVRFAEEEAVDLPESLDGLPVVCCGLHSQIAPVCAALKGRRIAYVQLAGGALPVSLSDTLRALRARRLLELTIGVSPCVDADLQCVTAASALVVAAARGAQAIVVGIGPGIVGTATRYGHGGMAVADAANAAQALGGRAVVAPRVSHGDSRERHRGLSHHTRAALSLCLGEPTVAWPAGLDHPDGIAVTVVDAGGWREDCAGLPLHHMGRGPDDDPWFFAAAYAAGALAADHAP
jgi:hypothetical protein